MVNLNKSEIIRDCPSEIVVVLVDCNGKQLPTCGLQTLSLFIEKEDGSFCEKAAKAGITWGFGNPTSLYVFEFTAEETKFFKLGVEQSVFVKIGFASSYLKFEFKDFLTVSEEIF